MILLHILCRATEICQSTTVNRIQVPVSVSWISQFFPECTYIFVAEEGCFLGTLPKPEILGLASTYID